MRRSSRLHGRYARRTTHGFNPKQLFEYQYSVDSHNIKGTIRVQRTLEQFRWYLKGLIEDGYPGTVPEGVGATVGCYAAAPGFGASFGAHALFVSNDKDAHEGKGTSPSDEVSRAYAFYKRELADLYPQLVSSHGYFEYRSLLAAVAQKWTNRPKTFETGRYELFGGQLDGSAFFELTVSTRVRIQSSGSTGVVKLTHITGEYDLKPVEATGHLFAGTNGKFSKVVTTTPPTVHLESAAGDCAVFLDNKGVLYALERKSGTSGWSLVPNVEREDENGDTLAAVSDGILDRGSIKKIWF